MKKRIEVRQLIFFPRIATTVIEVEEEEIRAFFEEQVGGEIDDEVYAEMLTEDGGTMEVNDETAVYTLADETGEDVDLDDSWDNLMGTYSVVARIIGDVEEPVDVPVAE